MSRDLSQAQCRLVGQASCSVSDRLAKLIHEPKAWRVAALVGTAQLLPHGAGLLAAASFAAESARCYYEESQSPQHSLGRLGSLAAAAVSENSEPLVQQVRDCVITLLTDEAALTASSLDGRVSGVR
jgi:hypothetical protein